MDRLAFLFIELLFTPIIIIILLLLFYLLFYLLYWYYLVNNILIYIISRHPHDLAFLSCIGQIFCTFQISDIKVIPFRTTRQVIETVTKTQFLFVVITVVFYLLFILRRVHRKIFIVKSCSLSFCFRVDISQKDNIHHFTTNLLTNLISFDANA